MPVVLHAHISDQKACQCSVLHKRNRNEGAYIILAKISDHILMLKEALTDLRCRKSLRILFDRTSYSKQYFLCHTASAVIVEDIRSALLIINI